MARLDQCYDVANLPVSERSGSFEPMPPGWYIATITSASIEKTNAGTGSYIKLRYDITGPTHQGRCVFGNLNIKNPNPKAEEIANQHLGEIMRAIGLYRVDDTDQLVGGTLSIKLSIKEASGDYDAGNEVKGFKSINGTMPPAGAPRPSAPSAPAAAKPPWAK